MTKPTAILLLSCPDQQGVVAEVAGFVYRHGGNIVHAEQHTDLDEDVFFQRVEFELDGVDLARRRSSRPSNRSPSASGYRSTFASPTSGARRHPGLEATALPLRPAHAVAHRRAGRRDPAGREQPRRPRRRGRVVGVDSATSPSRPDQAGTGSRGRAPSADHRVDLVVLARYMQILSPAFTDAGRTGSSTSTTRSCPPSSGPSRTTRPTTAASRLLVSRPTTPRPCSTTGRSSPRTSRLSPTATASGTSSARAATSRSPCSHARCGPMPSTGSGVWPQDRRVRVTILSGRGRG